MGVQNLQLWNYNDKTTFPTKFKKPDTQGRFKGAGGEEAQGAQGATSIPHPPTQATPPPNLDLGNKFCYLKIVRSVQQQQKCVYYLKIERSVQQQKVLLISY